MTNLVAKHGMIYYNYCNYDAEVYYYHIVLVSSYLLFYADFC